MFTLGRTAPPRRLQYMNRVSACSFSDKTGLDILSQMAEIVNIDTSAIEENHNGPLQAISAFLNVPSPVNNIITALCPEAEEATEQDEDVDFALPLPATHPASGIRWYRSPFGHTFCLLLWMSYLSSGGGITLLPMLQQPTIAPEFVGILQRLEFASWIIYLGTSLVLFIFASSLRRFYPPYEYPRAYLATTIFVQTVVLPYILSDRSIEWKYSYAFTTQAVISVFVELCLHKSKVKRH